MYRREAKRDGRAAVCCALCDSNVDVNESSRVEASLLWNTFGGGAVAPAPRVLDKKATGRVRGENIPKADLRRMSFEPASEMTFRGSSK